MTIAQTAFDRFGGTSPLSDTQGLAMLAWMNRRDPKSQIEIINRDASFRDKIIKISCTDGSTLIIDTAGNLQVRQ